MLVYFMALSKYIILILMCFYTLESLFSLIKKKHRDGILIRQEVDLFLIQFVAFLTLTLRTGELEYLFFYAFLQIILICLIVLSQMIYPDINREISNHMAMLLGIGFIILARLNFDKAVKQLIIAAVSIIIAFFIPTIIRNFKMLKHLKWAYASVGISALAMVLILGQVTNGSKISYSIAGITIQPSEFVKIIFVFCIAGMLYRRKNFINYLISALVAATHVMILVLSKDLGSALIFFVTYMAMLLVASKNYLYLLLGLSAGSGAAVVAYQIFTHVQVRVQAFLDPFSVIDKEGYQITQSLFAIACGGFFGTGLKKGVPENIPFVESDFIFSAVSEEFGVFFAICLLLICVFSFLLFMQTAMKVQDNFYRLVSVGIGVMYIFQVFLTVGGGIKFIPLTGVTLPFVSYGGSSIFVSIITFTILQGISLIVADENEQEDEDEDSDFDEDDSEDEEDDSELDEDDNDEYDDEDEDEDEDDDEY